jgi:hypothetical protein
LRSGCAARFRPSIPRALHPALDRAPRARHDGGEGDSCRPIYGSHSGDRAVPAGAAGAASAEAAAMRAEAGGDAACASPAAVDLVPALRAGRRVGTRSSRSAASSEMKSRRAERRERILRTRRRRDLFAALADGCGTMAAALPDLALLAWHGVANVRVRHVGDARRQCDGRQSGNTTRCRC